MTKRATDDNSAPASWLRPLLACTSAATGLFVLTAIDRAGAGPPDHGSQDQIGAALAAVRAAEARRVEVFDDATKAVVCIFSDDQRGGGGSGVVIDPAGYGLTNFHVVQPLLESRRGFGGLSDGRLYPLRLLGIDPGGDIAMFKLEGAEHFACAPLGDSDTLCVGQWVAAMGNPFMLAEDFSPTITLGVVSGLHRYQYGQGNLLEYADCIQVSTSINPGNSGGPLFDPAGRVVGINGRASFEDEEHRQRVNVGLGYAVSVNQIKRFLPGLQAGRLVQHGTLGATVRHAGNELLVSAVQPLSAAERAGVQLGDELLELAGRRLWTPNDYQNILATLPANWPVALKLRRDGKALDVVARLDRVPLRAPLLYVVDIEHNHAELARLLDRHARRMGTRVGRPFSRVTFAGRVRSETGSADRAFTMVVASPAEAPFAAIDTQPATDDPFDVTLRDEWRALARPLLARPELDLSWELLDGDEVAGHIAGVVERRLDSGGRVRWKFDWQTSELLQVTVGDGEQPEAVVWQPASVQPFGETNWPRTWTRRTSSGNETVIEIESVTILPPGPDPAPRGESQQEAGR
jgi:S1-C subfamily serine protease